MGIILIVTVGSEKILSFVVTYGAMPVVSLIFLMLSDICQIMFLIRSSMVMKRKSLESPGQPHF